MADKKAQELFNGSDMAKENAHLVKRNAEIIQEHNRMVKKHNEVAVKYNKLLPENKKLEEENQTLKKENGSLREQIKEISHEFSAWKERAALALHNQFKRVKGLLNAIGVEPDKLKALDKAEDRIVSASIKEIEKPKERTQTQEREM